MVVCITGCSRGIGKSLSLYYANNGNTVIAGMRDIQKHIPHNNITNIIQDLADPKKAAVSLLSALHGKNIDLLIHNAGIYPNRNDKETIMHVTAATITNAIFINAAAAIELTRYLLEESAFANKAKVVGMSSELGSITHALTPRHYSYAMSKAAMNMGFTIMAKDLSSHNIDCFVMSPGWIQTDMGGNEAPLTLEKACPSIMDTIAKWKKGDPQFVNNKGHAISW